MAKQGKTSFKVSDERMIKNIPISSDDPYFLFKNHKGQKVQEILNVKGMKAQRVENKRMPVLLNHDRDTLPKGYVHAVRTKGGKNYADLMLTDNEMWDHYKAGLLNSVSIGYKYLEMIEESKDDEYNIRVDGWELFEVSFVTVPADATVGGQRGVMSEADFAKDLHTRSEKTIILQRGSNLPFEDLPEPSKSPKQEANPEMDIAKLKALGADDKFIVKAMEAKWTDDQAAAELKEYKRKLEIEELKEALAAERSEKEALKRAADEVEKSEDKPEDKEAEAKKRSASAFDEDFKPRKDTEFKKSATVKTEASANPRYNLGKVLASMGSESSKKLDGYEAEFNSERAKFRRDLEDGRQVSEKSVFVPSDVLARGLDPSLKLREVTDTTASAGGLSDDGEHLPGMFIEALRTRSVLGELGVTMMNLTNRVSIPKQTTVSTTGWIDPDGTSDASEADPVYGNVTLDFKTIGGLVKSTRLVDKLSNPSFRQLAMSDIAISIKDTLCRGTLEGTGLSNQPTGINITTGVGSVTVTKNDDSTPLFTPDRDELIDMETAVYSENVMESNPRFLMTTKMYNNLRKVKIDDGSGEFLIDKMTGLLEGRKVVRYNGFSGTGNTKDNNIFFGEFSNAIVGMYDDIEFRLDENVDGGGTHLRAYCDVDTAVRHAEAFCIAS